jgi:hypothetical protein
MYIYSCSASLHFLNTRVTVLLVSATIIHSCNYCIFPYMQQRQCPTGSDVKHIASHALCPDADYYCFRCSKPATTGARGACLLHYNYGITVPRCTQGKHTHCINSSINMAMYTCWLYVHLQPLRCDI